MKLVKLSLVAALAAGSFSALNAAPLNEVINDIDVSGILRFRYESGRINREKYAGLANIVKFQSGQTSKNVWVPQRGLNTSKQNHKYKAQLNFNAAIADNFKAFVQLEYTATDGGYGQYSVSPTNRTAVVRQVYLTYNDDNTPTKVIFGKQQLNTIWTDDLVGTGVKVLNNSIDGLTLAAFAVDSFNQDGDITPVPEKIGNLYGGAAIGSYDALNGQFDSQLWGAYLDSVGAFYALDLAYGTTIFDNVDWKIEGAYLGNYLDKTLVEDGNFFGLKGSIKVDGWDASLGGVYYGDKSTTSLITIEDQGDIDLLAGQEIFNTEGSHLNGDVGRNIFGYATLGYTFDETVRLGADFVYGGTQTGNGLKEGTHGGEKMEAVARASYKYTPKLSFSAFYSYLNVDQGKDTSGKNLKGEKDTVRLQALYKF